jgi:hypothetical protein
MDISEFSRLNDKSNYQRHPWETSRVNVAKHLIKSFRLKLPVQRIVDIGGGDAFVINSLYANNFAGEYFAIDIAYTPDVIAQLKVNYNNSPITYLNSLEEYIEKYNDNVPTLFLCMDVLEHLDNEGVILSHLTSNPHNYYFFSVPAFQSVFSSHDVLLGHYRRYTLSGFKSMLSSYGFTIQKKGYYFTSLLILRWLEKLLKKDKKESIDNWEGTKRKTAIINNVLTLDFKTTTLLGKMGITVPGLSCYCLCKK